MDPIHLLLAATLPSAERRVATRAMEAATRRAMGATAEAGIKIPLLASEGLWKRVEQDIANVKAMKPGWRKSLNEFLMHEGPTSILYLPSEHGMRIGETLGKITKNLPLEARDNLANLVSLDPERARQALMRYEGVVDEAQQLAGRLPTGSLDAKKVENALKMVNSAMDKLQPVVDAIKENPLPGALITGGGTGFLLNKLQSKTASTHHADAFIRGFERAVQK